jgi:hypothetical protein
MGISCSLLKCGEGDAVRFLSLCRGLGSDNDEGCKVGHGRVREMLRLCVLCHRCSYDTLSRIDAAGEIVFTLGQEARYGLLDLGILKLLGSIFGVSMGRGTL